MSEEQSPGSPREVTDPGQVEVMRYNILTQWMYLPPEHQAEMLLVLLKHTLEAQARSLGKTVEIPSIPRVLERLRGEQEPEEFNIPFEITSLSREDLKEVVGEEDVAQFDDADMRRLAEKLADAYVGSGIFWDDLELFARQILRDKSQEADGMD